MNIKHSMGKGCLRGLALCLVVSAVGAQEISAERWDERWDDSWERGWFWYEAPAPEPAQPQDPSTALPDATDAADSDEAILARFEAFQKKVQASRARAFLQPTPKNIRDMAALQTAFVQRSSDVADVWQRTIWANPEFDFTLERPVNPLGLAAYEQERTEKRANTLERLAATHVFYFFFKSDCPYCHAFAPVLQAFSVASGIAVFPVSLDGGALPDFPAPVRDNGMARTLQVDTVPALFLADPGAGTIMPVGFGVLNEMDLAQRVVALANEAPEPVRSATPLQRLSESRP